MFAIAGYFADNISPAVEAFLEALSSSASGQCFPGF